MANFSRTKFGKIGENSFQNATFAKDFFDRTRFRKEVGYNSVVFGEESDVFFRKPFLAKKADFQYCTAEGDLSFSNLRQDKKNYFDFQEAAFEKANRVSFHSITLCPGWLVNVEARNPV